MNLDFLLQLLIIGVIQGMLYGVVAMSFVLIYKASQVVNFAQGEFLLIGAWVCWWFLTDLRLPFPIAFLVTLAFMFAFGVLLQVVVLRPLIGEPVISVIMVTIGLTLTFQSAVTWIFGVSAQPYPPIFATQAVDVAGVQVNTVYLLSIAVSVVIMALFAWYFRYSRMGLAMRATAFNQQVAQSMGISVRGVFATAWAISAMVSAVAGVVVGVVNGVSSALSFYGIKVFPAVILGGLDSVVGAVVGGLIVGILESVAHWLDVTWLNWGNMYRIAPFYALILILMIKPYGLFGTRDIERV
jgi:branched-chain amino acid transport system permease protein